MSFQKAFFALTGWLMLLANGAFGHDIERGDYIKITAQSASVMRGQTLVTTVPRGQRVLVSEVRGNWIGVFLGKEGGWIRSRDVARDVALETDVASQKEPGKLQMTEVIYEQALELLNEREYVQAGQKFGELIRKEPDHVKAYLNRGFCLVMQRQYEKAIPDFTRTVELRPEYAYAYVNRSTCYRMTGNYDRAIADLTEAIRLDPKFAMAYYQRSFSYEAKGLEDQARADRQKALELDPTLE